MKKMFNRIWKEQIVQPKSKVGIFKPKQGFDLEEEEDENKCMEEVEKIGDYILSEFEKVKNQKFESNNPEHPFLYQKWTSQNYMQKPEVNPWAMFSYTPRHYDEHDFIGEIEPGIIWPQNEEEACMLIKAVDKSIKKRQPHKEFPVGPYDNNSIGIDTRNIYSIPFDGSKGLFGMTQFILTLEIFDTDGMKYVIDWFKPFIYRISKMFSDAHHRLKL